MIIFGWNSYRLKTISLLELGLAANDLPDAQIEYRQKYFHFFFIPFFPIGRFWAVRQGGKLYHIKPELEDALRNVETNWKEGIWAWSGPLIGIVAWLIFIVTN